MNGEDYQAFLHLADAVRRLNATLGQLTNRIFLDEGASPSGQAATRGATQEIEHTLQLAYKAADQARGIEIPRPSQR